MAGNCPGQALVSSHLFSPLLSLFSSLALDGSNHPRSLPVSFCPRPGHFWWPSRVKRRESRRKWRCLKPISHYKDTGKEPVPSLYFYSSHLLKVTLSFVWIIVSLSRKQGRILHLNCQRFMALLCLHSLL